MIKKPLSIKGRGADTLGEASLLLLRTALVACLFHAPSMAAENQKTAGFHTASKTRADISEALKMDPAIAIQPKNPSLQMPTHLFYMNGANFRIDIEKLLDFPKFAIGLKAHLGRAETRGDALPPNLIPHEAKGLLYLQKKF